MSESVLIDQPICDAIRYLFVIINSARRRSRASGASRQTVSIALTRNTSGRSSSNGSSVLGALQSAYIQALVTSLHLVSSRLIFSHSTYRRTNDRARNARIGTWRARRRLRCGIVVEDRDAPNTRASLTLVLVSRCTADEHPLEDVRSGCHVGMYGLVLEARSLENSAIELLINVEAQSRVLLTTIGIDLVVERDRSIDSKLLGSKEEGHVGSRSNRIALGAPALEVGCHPPSKQASKHISDLHAAVAFVCLFVGASYTNLRS